MNSLKKKTMKKQILNSLTTAFFLSLIIFISCGGNDDGPSGPSDAEVQFALLAKTWTVTSATADSNPVDGWTDLTITFGGTATAGTFRTNGQQPDGTTLVWPASGSWTFASEDNVNTITRNDGVEISIAVDDTRATLNFTIVDNSGRTDIVEGAWRFELTPQ